MFSCLFSKNIKMFASFTETELENAFQLKTLPSFIYFGDGGVPMDIMKVLEKAVEEEKTFSETMSKINDPRDEWLHYYVCIFNEHGPARHFNSLILEGEFPALNIEEILRQNSVNTFKRKKLEFFKFMKDKKSACEKLCRLPATDKKYYRNVETVIATITFEKTEDVYALFERCTLTGNVKIISLDGIYKVELFSTERDFKERAGFWIQLKSGNVVSIEEEKTTYVVKYTEKTNENTEALLVECNLLPISYAVKILTNVSYFIPDTCASMWFFVDFLMLNCSNIAVCEKSNQSENKWNLKFLFQKTVSVVISNKLVNTQCGAVKLFGPEIFAIDSQFLKISILKADSLEEEKLIVDSLLRLLEYFDQMVKKSIEEDYTRLLPLFQFDNVVACSAAVHNSNKYLKLLAPDMFITDYPRKCLHLPRVVSYAEAAELEKRGIPTLAFPTKGEGGRMPFMFACDHHPTAPYPGLRKNPLKNKKTFPVLPCCYIGDQRKRKGSEYRIYYTKDTKTCKQRKPNDYVVFTTSRCLPNNVFGQIPKEIVDLFPPRHRTQFFRFGVERSEKSFLKCLEKATGKQLTQQPHLLELNRCRQESSVPIVNQRDFIAFYEYYFGVNIVVFVENEGKFELGKRGCSSYVSLVKYSFVVIVIENAGTVADNLDSVQFELVVQMENDDRESVKYLFADDDVRNVLNACQLFYNYKFIQIPECIAQKIDCFGKMKAAKNESGDWIKFSHFRPPPAPVEIVKKEICNSVLDGFKENVLHAENVKHFFNYWGAEEFQKRATVGKVTYDRNVGNTIQVASQKIIQDALRLERQIVDQHRPPLFLSFFDHDNVLVLRSKQRLQAHFEQSQFRLYIEDKLCYFVECDTVAFLPGGKMYSVDPRGKIVQQYSWGTEERKYLVFENVIFGEKV